MNRLEAAALRKLARDNIGKPSPSRSDAASLPADLEHDAPTTENTKAEIVKWLAGKGIGASPRETKAKLLDKVGKA